MPTATGDEWAAWLDANAAKARRALADPAVRAELLGLLGTTDAGRRRERRLAAAREELAGREVRLRLTDDDGGE